MINIVASLLALALGPLCWRLALSARFLLAILDGFMIVAIGGLVLFEILPECVQLAGWGAVPVALAGLLVPSILERVRHHVGAQAHRTALYLAVAGILVHAFIDGVALTTPEMLGSSSPREYLFHALPLAVILHRVPVGLAVWLLLRPAVGARAAVAVLAAIGGMTVAGFFLGETASRFVESTWMGYFAALVAGALLHVVVQTPSPRSTQSMPLIIGTSTSTPRVMNPFFAASTEQTVAPMLVETRWAGFPL